MEHHIINNKIFVFGGFIGGVVWGFFNESTAAEVSSYFRSLDTFRAHLLEWDLGYPKG